MKLSRFFTIIIFTAAISSCTGPKTETIPSNPYFGTLPALYERVNLSDSLTDAKLMEMSKRIRSQSELLKAREKYRSMIEAKKDHRRLLQETIAGARDSLPGTIIPCMNENELYEVSGLKITDVQNNGIINMSATLRFTNRTSADIATSFPVKYEARTADGEVILDGAYNVRLGANRAAHVDPTVRINVDVSKNPGLVDFAVMAFL